MSNEENRAVVTRMWDALTVMDWETLKWPRAALPTFPSSASAGLRASAGRPESTCPGMRPWPRCTA